MLEKYRWIVYEELNNPSEDFTNAGFRYVKISEGGRGASANCLYYTICNESRAIEFVVVLEFHPFNFRFRTELLSQKCPFEYVDNDFETTLGNTLEMIRGIAMDSVHN